MKRILNTKFIIGTLIVVGFGTIAAPTARSDIYSWTDADGVRHFSNKPPRGDVTAARRSQEIAYDAAGDRKNQEEERRFFEERAMQNTLRRLEQTERALKERLDRAREAESRADDWQTSYRDGYLYYGGAPKYWGTFYGSKYGGFYDRADRKRWLERERRYGRRHKRPSNDRDGRWKHRRHGDDSKDARIRRHNRIGHQRLSKRERGVRSGLTRAVRAIPSPYYMGYRPVYSGISGSSYKPRRGGHGHRAYHRGGGGGFRGGGRVRIGF
ncbi:MAG: DUF4124 domain-containing protein [Desulfobacterales bacterium]|nr:DUF4124 domain-containing protein [Desulfobacterales bacterium]